MNVGAIMSLLVLTQGSMEHLRLTGNWRRYVTDHIEHLRKSAKVISLTLEEAHMYEYRPCDVLRDRRYPLDMLDIFLLLNGYSSELEFKNMSQLLIPNHDDILEHYQTYRTMESLK
jgi:hypothetical protein